MSIEFNKNIHKISQKQFNDIDYQITGLAFQVHNDLGRLWSETIYQHELANRCRNAGFSNVNIEAPICISYKNFIKKYYVDLLVEDSIVYELKTANRLTSIHEMQTLNYLFLLGLYHGKLINFKSDSIQKKFVSTSINPEDRYNFSINSDWWLGFNDESIWFKELMIELIKDWGTFLNLNLFYEAICHFKGGIDKVLENIDVINNGIKLGKQKVHLLSPKVAFKITASTRNINYYEQNLKKFINLTKLDAIQWVNFNKTEIVFKTISK